MAQCSATEICNVLNENCLLDPSYLDRCASDIESYYPFRLLLDKGIGSITEIVKTIAKLTSGKINHRGKLCVLTNNNTKLKELKEELENFDPSINFKSIENINLDNNEIIARLNWAKKYGFPYVDANSAILKDVFETGENSYLRNYGLDETICEYSYKFSFVQFCN